MATPSQRPDPHRTDPQRRDAPQPSTAKAGRPGRSRPAVVAASSIEAAAIAVGGIVGAGAAVQRPGRVFRSAAPQARRRASSSAWPRSTRCPTTAFRAQFPVIAERVDAWNRSLRADRRRLSAARAGARARVECLTATCPHAGCFVGFRRAERTPSNAPATTARLRSTAQIIAPSPSPRPMDTLECEVRAASDPRQVRELLHRQDRKSGQGMKALLNWLDDRTGIARLRARGALRAHSRRRPLALRVGQHAGLRVRRAGHHRHLPVDVLQPQRADRLGKRVLHPARDAGRLAAARAASLHGPGDGRAAGAAPDAGRDRRRLSGSARSEFLARPDPDADRAGLVADRLSAAVGPEGLLGHARGHEPAERGAARRPAVAAARRRRRRLRPSHADAILRAARRRAAGACWSRFWCCTWRCFAATASVTSSRPRGPTRRSGPTRC